MTEQQNKILILGSSTKAAVYVTKQLKKYGLHVTIVDWIDSPVRYSKYVDEFIILSSPLNNVTSFINEFTELLKTNKFNCMIPIHDPAVEICIVYREQINALCKIIGLNTDAIQDYSSDKSVLYNLAKEVGIKVPKSTLVTNLKDLDGVLDKLTFPCALKPVRSALLKDNRIYVFKVKITNSKNEAIDFVRENVNNVNLLIQEYIEGYGIGYNIFAKNGEILNAYIHRRINEYKGISSYRESLPVTKYGLQPLVTELVKRMRWSGVAMIEFKIQNNVPYLMEMNGRFWGSIDVAVKSGLNYPEMLYESEFLNKEVSKNLPVKQVKVRNLKDEVIIYFDKLLKHGKIIEFVKWLWLLLSVVKPNNYIEDNFFDNPLFVTATYYYELKRIIKKRRLKSKIKSVKIDYRKPSFKPNNQYSVAFVCSGNICRSPFAEKYAQKINTQYKFSSFGTSPYDHRLSPVNAVNAASSFDVDLSSFQSKSINPKTINSFDYVIVFDKKNYVDALNKGVNKEKIFFLSEQEIADPYGRDEQTFINEYAIIKNKIDLLLQ